ncbi:MAG: hypothetical protein ABIJ50_14025 [Pseudomonadota bacterium]
MTDNFDKAQLEYFDELLNFFGETNLVRDICTINLISQLVENEVFFVHPRTEENINAWSILAAEQYKRFVVFVSSDPQGLNTVPQVNGVYTLKASLSSVVKLLQNQPDRLTRFKESCEQGKPDMTCFYLSFPEHLVAAYLLGLAFNKNASLREKDFPDELWNSASREYVEHSGEEGVLNCDTICNQLSAIEKILKKFEQYSTC